MQNQILVFSFLFSSVFFSCQQAPKRVIADTIYYNGQVITMEETSPKVSSLAVKDGKILSIGGQSLVAMHKGHATQLVDLQGKTLLPGFIDAHSHFGAAMSLMRQVDLSSPPVGDIKNIPDIVSKLKTQQEKYDIKKGDWIIGWGYDPDQLEEKRHPNKLDLDEAFPDNPVYILHVSAHMAVVNSRALAAVGIDADTPNPEGGMIVRLPNSNEPSGLMQESASDIFRKEFPVPTPKQLMVLLDEIQDYYAAQGITTAQAGLTDYPTYQFLQKAAAAGKLKIDVEALASFQTADAFFKNLKGEFGKSQNGLRLAGLKIVSDGSPQGKTAFFSQPYLTDVPGCVHDCKGFPNLTKAQIKELMKECYSSDIQLFTHANGDGAIGLFLEIHKEVINSLPNISDDLRSVIIHSQFVRPDQLELYKKYKMIPAYFTNHAFFWGDVHIENLGIQRASFLSPMKTTMDMGIICTNHTDFIVTPINQLFLLWTAVNRTTRNGKVLGPTERLSPLEGLKAITINAAYQHRQENSKGSIKVGKLADFVILNQNPLTIDPQLIKDIQVMETIKDGKRIYWR